MMRSIERRNPVFRLRILLTALIYCLAAHSAHATTLHVPSEYATIQEAVNAVQYLDTLLIAPGVYTGIGNTDLLLNKALYLFGEDPATTIIDCESLTRGIHIPMIIPIEIRNISIINGRAEKGGGIYVSNSTSLDLSQVILRGNRADYGGAIYLNDSVNLNIENSTIVRGLNSQVQLA